MPADVPTAAEAERAAEAARAAEAEKEAEADLPGVGRLLSLSDGVVAIALTLLVLQLAVPTLQGLHHQPDDAGQLASALGSQGDQFVSYLISFYVIAQFWLAHHRVFRHISGHHEGLAWWNFVFLFTITIMPFSSNLLGDYASNPLAVDIFALNLLLASLSTQAVVVFGRRRHLFGPGVTPAVVTAGRVRSTAVIGVAVLSMGLAWVSTDAAKYSWLLIAIAPWVANRWRRRLALSGAPA
jgi:uncharacterized membrane protein